MATWIDIPACRVLAVTEPELLDFEMLDKAGQPLKEGCLYSEVALFVRRRDGKAFRRSKFTGPAPAETMEAFMGVLVSMVGAQRLRVPIDDAVIYLAEVGSPAAMEG